MNDEIKQAASDYAARGWYVFPAPQGQKKSEKSEKHSGTKWGMTTDAAQIARDWAKWPQANVGIVTGPKSGFFVVEADTPQGHDVDGIGNLAALIDQNGPLPDTIEALSPSGSWHIYFKWPDGVDIANSAGQVAPGVDVRGDGGMVIGVPSVKPGADLPYRWKNPPGLFDLADCPEWLVQLCLKAQPKLSERAMPSGRAENTAWADAALRGEIGDLLAAPEGQRNAALNKVAFSLAQIVAGGGLDEQTVRQRLSATASGIGLDPSEIAATIESGFVAGLQTPRGASADDRTVQAKIDSAFDNPEPAPEPRSFDELLEAAKALQPGQIDEMEAIVLECTQLNPMRADAVFRAIKDAAKVPLGTIRAQLSQERDAIPEPDHLDLARLTLDEIGRDNVICTDAFVWRWQARGVWTQQDDRAIKQAVQRRLDYEAMIDVTANLVNGVTDVFKSDIYRPDHEFNLGNPETVNCLNGELELQGGKWTLRPHCRENYRTTQIPVAYDPQADAPLFRSFLEQVFRDDPDMLDKIKCALELMGYTLMSHARHELFAMLIGPGANGKSVLLAILEGLAGVENVAGVQPANFDRSFQRAHLHQKLANIVTELKQGEVIADAELKAITSGEPSTVEHKFKDPFVMRPFATCWFGTNHMPHTRDFSEALFRRATILQFNRTFAKYEQDPQLKGKLLAELPGILNMALDAYALALTDGFTAPASSEAAKQEWRLEADQVAQFVDDVCTPDAEARATSTEVFRAYKDWAASNGINKTMSQKGLRERLTRLGFGADKDRVARYVTGLRVPSWMEAQP